MNANNTFNPLADPTLRAEETEILYLEVYGQFLSILLYTGALALTSYTTILNISREIDYIWTKPFRLPTLLYLFTSYGGLASQGFSRWLYFGFRGHSHGDKISCEIVFVIGYFITFLLYIGVQGVLVIPAYSLCRGNKIIAGALGFGFAVGVLLELLSKQSDLSCLIGHALRERIKVLPWTMFNSFEHSVSNSLPDTWMTALPILYIDVLVFGICSWKFWGAWKLKRKAGLQFQGSNGLVSLVLKQTIFRCCVAAIITAIPLVFADFPSNPVTSELLSSLADGGGVQTFQNAFSIILITDYILRLRQYNSIGSSKTSLSLPTSQIRNALQREPESLFQPADREA